MKRLAKNRGMKNPIMLPGGRNEKLRRKTIAVLTIATIIISTVFPTFIILSEVPQAKADLMCPHIHSNECYITPDGHMCSEKDGCTPLYPQAYETEDETEENTNEDASPLGWICRVEPDLVCEHRNCIVGELCERKKGSNPSDGADVPIDSIYGFLWVDGDGTLPTDWDGIYNGEEGPLANYIVFLYTQDDLTEPVAQTQTDKYGTYIFGDLEPDSYIVGIAPDVVDGVEYLLPLSETGDNESMIYSDVIVINKGESAEGISAGLRLFTEETEEPTDAEEGTEELTDAEEGTEEPADTEEGTEEPTDAEEGAEEPTDAEEGTEEPAATEEEADEPTDGEEETEEPDDVNSGNSISGHLWLDIPEMEAEEPFDSLWGEDEVPLAGYPVFLFREDEFDDPLGVTFTDTDGWYEFPNIEPDRYVLGAVSARIAENEFLVPLDKTSQNHFEANIPDDPDTAYTDVLEIDYDTILTDINCAMHNPIDIGLAPMAIFPDFYVYHCVDWIKALIDPFVTTIHVMRSFSTNYIMNTTLANRSGGTLKIVAGSGSPVITAAQNYRHFIIPSYSNVSRIDISNVTFDGYGGLGGILSEKSGELTITGYSARRCNANNGGAIYAAGNLTLTGYSISNCTAWDGGGIYAAGRLALGNGDISGCTATSKGGGACVLGSLTINGSAVISNNRADSGGGVFANGAVSMTTGRIDRNKATRGGGIYFIANSTNTLSISSGDITGNQAVGDGGGIYASDLRKIYIGASVNFSGNTAQKGCWLADYADTATYNPGVLIKVSEIKALHGPTAQIKSTVFSSSPGGSSKPFTYLANNYDLNCNVGSITVEPVDPGNTALGYVSNVDFGIGNLPKIKTLYGLNGMPPDRYANVPNHVINKNASNVNELEINVILATKEQKWEITLRCSDFTANGVTEKKLRPVVVGINVHGNLIGPTDLGGSPQVMYSRTRYNNDSAKGLIRSRYDPITSTHISTVPWSLLASEIKIQAEPLAYQLDVPYQSVFTWTFEVTP